MPWHSIPPRARRRLAGVGLLAALWAGAAPAPAAEPAPTPTPAPAAAPDAQKLFDPIASVLTHPRCLNCHQAARPAQTDASVPHLQQVLRGANGTGVPALQCAACHQDRNSADGRVPGAPHWHLAPVGMAWEGLTRTQICRQLKDPARNGGRKTPEQVIEHMRIDPLVLWAWEPGAARSTPSITHAQFLRRLEAWAQAGMPCPQDPPQAR